MKKNYKRVKYACYTTNLSMSVITNLPPLLFLTFREVYGISFSLLGFLVLLNYVTQLLVDIAFSFFSHKFNLSLSVRLTPVLTSLGLLIFSLSPFLFAENVYAGLVIGTVIFSASGGLCEVLISPVIAAIPSDNPDSEMSKLHSVYAWGVVGTVIIASLFLLLFGTGLWWLLSLIFLSVPLIASVLFATSTLPHLEKPERASGIVTYLRNPSLYLCVGAIFLGGAIECTMAQWSSSYIENALGIDKIWGDIFGVALFALMLGLGRTLYSKFGKNVTRVLTFGAIGATVCYLTAVFSSIAAVGLLACAMTGLCASMMWPGSLIAASDRFPSSGVFIYAMMAAGGDLGASVGPQLVGIITDAVASSSLASELAKTTSLSPDEIGMKAGLLIGAVVSLTAVFLYAYMWRSNKKSELDRIEQSNKTQQYKGDKNDIYQN